MGAITRTDVLVVGAGPAGMSTVLHLAAAGFEAESRVLVLEKAVHPRHKPCGGGLTPTAQRFLDRLGVTIGIPHVMCDRPTITFDRYQRTADLRTLMVRRDLFDDLLVRCARDRGVRIREGEAVAHVERRADGVAVFTPQAEYHARVVVAADGSKSVVRRCLVASPDPAHQAKLMEVVEPVDARQCPLFREETFLADLSVMRQGISGYYWEFPCIVDGRPSVNRGLFDNRLMRMVGGLRPSAPMVEVFRQRLRQSGIGLHRDRLEGHPLRCYDDRAVIAQPRVVFAGDAAGVDPLFGEGISYALGYGAVAARVILHALRSGDLSFATYRAELARTPIGRNLRWRAMAARLLAAHGWLRRPRVVRELLRLAPVLVPNRPLGAGD